MSNLIRTTVFFAILALVAGHSQMRCAKYDKATKKCYAPIRRQPESYLQEGYSWNTGSPICQFPMASPITASYSNGAACPEWAGCPDAMGSYAPGETFTVMWFARNHAVENQSPGTVDLYLSPIEDVNQGSDVSLATMEAGKFCTGPYMNCGGENVDQTHCTLTCTFPKVAKGYYTMWWKWSWQGGAKYATCADVVVSASGSTPTPATTAPASTAPATTAPASTSSRTTAPASTSSKTTAPASTSSRTTAPATSDDASTSNKLTTGEEESSTGDLPPDATTGTISCVDEITCYNETFTQRCYNNQLLAPLPCQDSNVCQPSSTSKYAYCVRIEDQDPVDLANPASFVQPTWVALILVAAAYLVL